MNEERHHAALIDLLAAGELDEANRRDLFSWLDREPCRWRRCALALLEARELEEAFEGWQSETPKPAAPLTRPSTTPISRPSAFFALAASVLLAFWLGIFARGFFVAPPPAIAKAGNAADREVSVGVGERAPPKTPVKQPQPRADQHPTTVAAAASTGQSDLIPAYIRSQLERRGYQLTSRSAQLPVVLPDGRRTTVPVDELQVNYVGQRTY